MEEFNTLLPESKPRKKRKRSWAASLNDMTTFNNRSYDSDFSELDSDTNNHDSGAGKGPWTHSTDSYSRKVTNPNERDSKLSKRTLCVIGTVAVVIFVVAFALGIVVGTFALKKNDQDQSDLGFTEDRLRRSTTQIQQPQTTPIGPSQCECTTADVPTTTSTTTTKTTNPSPECQACGGRSPDESTGQEYLLSPFAALTKKEINKAYNYMLSKGNTTAGRYLNVNRISHIYLYSTSKSKVLNYLDNGGANPGRYAKVHVFRGAQTPPDVMEYKLGPLHLPDDQMTLEQLRQDGEIDFNRRPYDGVEIGQLMYISSPHFRAMRTLLEESFDGNYFASGIYHSYSTRPSYNTSDRISSVHLYLRLGGTSTIRIIPVTCLVHHPGVDTTTWWASDFYYLSQGPFDSGQAVQDAYNAGNLRKVRFPTGYSTRHDHEFDLVQNLSLPNRAYADLPPPRTYEPQGPRYTVKGGRVSWMDWDLEFTSNVIRGPAVYDVRFKGNRIAYEISLQDVTLMYSSQSNGAGPPALSDTLFFLGDATAPRLGYDCPERSTLITLATYTHGPREKASACVFEADGQESAWKYRKYGILSTYLVVRSLMNLGNYEYSVEWQFHLDGTVETVTTASGYLYGAYWDGQDPLLDADKGSTPFGYRLADYMLGPIHDHSYAFKVDVDILGHNNSLEILHWRAGDVLDALQTQTNTTEVPGYFPFTKTRYIEYELKDKEAGFVINPMKPKYYTIVNENERNFWGVKRGYRLVPHSVGAENFNDHVMFGPWGHLKYNLAVSKRKDSEEYATNSIYDIYQPTVAFGGVLEMLNNETIRNEDLVFWVTEKFFHAPSAEDLPMTLKVKRGFSLKPFNYFDRTPVFDMPAHYQNSFEAPYTIEPCSVPTR